MQTNTILSIKQYIGKWVEWENRQIELTKSVLRIVATGRDSTEWTDVLRFHKFGCANLFTRL